MKVRATRLGYYVDRRVKVGEIFEVPESHFSDKWMEKVEGEKPAKKSKASKEPEQDAGEGSTGDADVI